MKKIKAIIDLLFAKDYIVLTLSENLRYKSRLKGPGTRLKQILQLFDVTDKPLIENNPQRTFNY